MKTNEEAAPKKNRRRGREKSKHQVLANIIMCGPMTLWCILFIIIPVILLIVMSFLTKGPLGVVQYKFTFKNYTEIFNPVYANVVTTSLIIAFWTTLLTVLIGYPFANIMAKVKKSTSSILSILLMLPLWVSGLVILYSFVILMNTSGTINTILMNIGILKKPLQILYTNGAVIVGMVYMFLPFAILPMFSSIEKLDPALIEASKDLGAGPVRTFFKVKLPLTSPGIFAAVILTFIPCIGYYMVSDMLGGGTSMLVGNLIQRQFTISRNWPFGAALSMVLAVIILVMVMIYSKAGGSLDDLA